MSGHPQFAPFTAVRLRDPFWSPRQAANRRETLPLVLDACRRTGRVDALRLQWKPGDPNPPHIFWESDLAKWLEGACHTYAIHPAPALRRRIDELTDLFAAAQQPDGYLNAHFTVVRPGGRFRRLRDAHELYNAGHLFEAGVAHRRATGETRLLDVCRRYADLLHRTFGPGEGQLRGYPGHPEIELALVALAEATGERRYLDLARFFVDERGRAPNYFLAEHAAARAENADEPPMPFDLAYYQADRPVRQQTDAAGHAVRALYLYAGMADVARLTGDDALARRCRRLWESVQRRAYITGGAGSRRADESFGEDYELPNATAYQETCAGIALARFAQRLFRLDPRGEYADAIETALYNNIAAGVSLDGRRFFYANPLAVPDVPERDAPGHVAAERRAWFDCSCCPTNVARFVPQVGGYAYAADDETVYALLYLAGEAHLAVGGVPVTLRQTTNYPWEETVTITVHPARPARFTLALRAPGWLREGAGALSVNGRPRAYKVKRGFVPVAREWRDGHQVEWRMPMPAERVYARPEVADACGRVALRRGPVVYCFEQKHNGANLAALSLPAEAPVTAEFSRKRLGGVVVLRAKGQRLAPKRPDDAPNRTAPPKNRVAPLTAVPYAAWNNSGPGGMIVWIRET